MCGLQGELGYQTLGMFYPCTPLVRTVRTYGKLCAVFEKNGFKAHRPIRLQHSWFDRYLTVTQSEKLHMGQTCAHFNQEIKSFQVLLSFKPLNITLLSDSCSRTVQMSRSRRSTNCIVIWHIFGCYSANFCARPLVFGLKIISRPRAIGGVLVSKTESSCGKSYHQKRVAPPPLFGPYSANFCARPLVLY